MVPLPVIADDDDDDDDVSTANDLYLSACLYDCMTLCLLFCLCYCISSSLHLILSNPVEEYHSHVRLEGQ